MSIEKPIAGVPPPAPPRLSRPTWRQFARQIRGARRVAMTLSYRAKRSRTSTGKALIC
jgi:hypothetical protein